ncbi:MAG TPA: hypothetical protein VL286_07720 [Rhizomicrobium sp.]|nr:hypothetical protein [Rhizomicrobium sp.]
MPAFAVQTGQPCQTCHIGAFGPQLTPFGRQFKMNGYTLRAGDTFTPPVSGMAIASFVHTQKDQPEPPAPGTHRNDNTALDEAAVFLAGGYGHVGGFAEITYEGLDHKWTWDNLDVRAVDHANLLGHDVLLGLSLNNSPTVQDVWATLPAWGFPFTDSDLMPGPDAATLISDALAQNVLGLNAYAWWDDHLYTEAGLYRSLSADFLKNVGVDPEETNDLDGAAPYLRAAWQQNYGDQNVEFGAFALFADFFPGRDRSTGKTDHFTDLGLDASYQFTGTGEHIFTLNSRYIHEIQTLDATQALGGTLSRDLNLNEININASYYYKNTYGVSAGAFGVWGDGDPLLYADSRTFSPDSQGFILQADVTPFGGDNPPLGTRVNVRVGLQYVVFTKFNGASSNFDGLGHNASDNNTLRLFLWTAF